MDTVSGLTAPRDRRAELMLSAAGARHGMVLVPQVARTGMADLPGVWHVGVPRTRAGDGWSSASGGVGRDVVSARLAAIGEALERYGAATCPIELRTCAELAGETLLPASEFSLFSPEQVAAPGFAFGRLYDADRARYARAFSLHDNAPAWVPHELVGLRDSALATSSGLAAGSSSVRALLRGVQEVVERDALMITWLHGVPGRQVTLAERYRADVAALGGRVTCIDATPAYSPHPVALVAGSAPLRGRARFSLGAACRGTWEEAVEKAYLEWAQGVFFVGEYLAAHPGLRFASYDDVTTFDAHAVYYSTAPREWERIALLKGHAAPAPAPRATAPAPPATVARELEDLVAHLDREGVRLLYRDLTTVDLRQIGLHAVRVLSPDLTPIHCHPSHPFLGGRARDVLWRYPWAAGLPLCFPNSMPHPLG